MNKINKLGNQLPALILGLIFTFYSIFYFEGGGGANITLGVFAILVALTYIAVGLLPTLLKAKGHPLFMLVFVLVFPLFYFVSDLITLIADGEYLDVVGWIMEIARMIAALGLISFTLMAFFMKGGMVSKLQNIFLLIFAAMLVLFLIFTPYGGVRTLGNVILADVMAYLSYLLVAFNKTAAKEDAEEQPEEEQE